MKKVFACLLALLAACALFFAALPALGAGAQENAAVEYGDAYLRILDALKNNMPDENKRIPVNLTGLRVTLAEVRKLTQAVSLLNPEYFYFEGGYSYYPSEASGYLKTIYLISVCEAGEIPQKQKEFDALSKELFDLYTGGGALETILFYHDYLAAHYEYDTSYVISRPMEFMRQKKGVCNAYAMTFQLIMNHFGIPCVFARSDAMSHVWNVVYVDGAWYHLDVTHDDPVSDHPGRAVHTYFLTGARKTAELKSSATDMEFGVLVDVCEDDHPMNALLAGSLSPVAGVGGDLYTALTDQNGAYVAKIDAASASASPLCALPTRWYVPGSYSYYPGCFTELTAHGSFIFYYTDDAVMALDPASENTVELIRCPQDKKIYGLRFNGNTLTAYLENNPNSVDFTETPVFMIGDLTGDLALDISDVTELLNALSGSASLSYPFLCDVDADGGAAISDVTALLNLLSV